MEVTDPTTMVTEVADYTELLTQMNETLNFCAEASTYINGFLLFFVVVVLCYFVYKFFRIFI